MTQKGKNSGASEQIQCSFCYTVISMEESKGRVVAGANVFICRDCVDLCIHVFSSKDPQWRDCTVASLTGRSDLKPKLLARIAKAFGLG
jgi:ATP-dependent protease Clp ATPase subunit